MVIEMERGSAKWLKGVVDVHMYAGPEPIRRYASIVDLARQARDVGYRALNWKSHWVCNCDAAQLAARAVPGIEIYGGVVLNYPVGGLNPFAVSAAVDLGGRTVWMGNMHAGTLSNEPFVSEYMTVDYPEEARRRFQEFRTKPWMKVKPLNVIDLESGELLPEVLEIIELIADADILLETCHLSKRECFALVPVASQIGVKKIAITHINLLPRDPRTQDPSRLAAPLEVWTLEEQQRIAEMGALLEVQAPKSRLEAPLLAEAIKAIGADKCFMVSGAGSVRGMNPIEVMRQFIYVMRFYGLSAEEVDMMTKWTPARLLGLE